MLSLNTQYFTVDLQTLIMYKIINHSLRTHPIALHVVKPTAFIRLEPIFAAAPLKLIIIMHALAACCPRLNYFLHFKLKNLYENSYSNFSVTLKRLFSRFYKSKEVKAWLALGAKKDQMLTTCLSNATTAFYPSSNNKSLTPLN